jgi:hypothetical protein
MLRRQRREYLNELESSQKENTTWHWHYSHQVDYPTALHQFRHEAGLIILSFCREVFDREPCLPVHNVDKQPGPRCLISEFQEALISFFEPEFGAVLVRSAPVDNNELH